jgi:O-Antigen ligase
MEATAMLPRQASAEHPQPRVDWGAIAIWLLAFGLVVYLGLKGGGYDPLVHDQVGIVVWWVLLAAVAVGALPRQRLGTLAWCGLGLLAAFVLWTALSLTWTESVERTAADLARVAGYLGVFALALFARDPRGARRLIGAVGAGIVVVTAIALLSRMHPAWFPEAAQTGRFLAPGRERLSYPLNYWNALAALIAIGLPLLLETASSARSVALRAASAAAIPALVLATFFTLSRGGIAAACVALAIFIAFSSDRLPRALTLAVAGGGGAILVGAALQRDSLRHGLLDATARHQGTVMLVMTLVVCLFVGLAQVGIAHGLAPGRRPRWMRVTRQQSLAAVLAGALIVLIAAAALDAPGKISNGWSEFKLAEVPGKGTERLGSIAGESRYQFWSAAVREADSKPLTGTGSGTFEYWWARDGDTDDIVRDTHSLYLQTLGELGIVGIGLLAAFLATILIAGGRATLRATEPKRPILAAALAGCTAFCMTATFDWMWQVPVLPVVLLLLASLLVAAADPRGSATPSPLRPPLRVGFSLVALAAIVAIAIPLASTTLIRQSQADAKDGDLAAALDAARSAQNAEPGAATPRLQQALLFETSGNLQLAATAALGATARESTNWRTWLVLSRIEAERGNADSAIRDFRRARSLNPHSSLFDR